MNTDDSRECEGMAFGRCPRLVSVVIVRPSRSLDRDACPSRVIGLEAELGSAGREPLGFNTTRQKYK